MSTILSPTSIRPWLLRKRGRGDPKAGRSEFPRARNKSMPVLVTDKSFGVPPVGERSGTRIVIGLVNNMPDPAIRATERQFGNLINAAAGNLDVKLRYFSLPDVPRSESARATFLRFYEDIDELWKGGVDGLIVTGAEPQTPELAHEPYWPALTRLIDWAEDNTISTIWSCLAAHAAVLHI